MMKLLSCIPSDCSYVIGMEWLELNDLCRLDSAVTSKTGREHFEQMVLYENHKLSAKLRPQHHLIKLLKWLTLRGMRCDSFLKLTDTFLSEICDVISNGSCQLSCLEEVKTVEYSVSTEHLVSQHAMLSVLVSACPMINSFNMKSRCYVPPKTSLLNQASVSLIYKTLSRLHTLYLHSTHLSTQTAVELLNTHPELCNIGVKNRLHAMEECTVCLLFAHAIHSVAKLSAYMFTICGHRRSVNAPYSVSGAEALFQGTTCDEYVYNTLQLGPDYKYRYKNVFECLEPVSSHLKWLEVEECASQHAKKYIETGGCLNLTSLKVGRNVDDGFVKCIAFHCKSLLEFTLVNANTVTDEALIELCIGIPGLTHLTLSDLLLIGDTAMIEGLANLHNLVFLYLALYRITREPLAEVIAGNVHLKCVTLACMNAQRKTLAVGLEDNVLNALQSLKKLVKFYWY